MAMVDPSSPDNGQTPLWKITNVRDAFTLAGVGQQTRIKQIDFELFNGTTSYVEVPFVRGWQDAAIKMVDEHARELIQLMAQQGESVG
jgi:hypothetical protein